MKKTLFVAALAAVMVLAFSAAAFAVGPFYLTSGSNGTNATTNGSGYLSWGYAKTNDAANNVGTPHGGYTTTTNKCATCHAVHRAAAGGSVLTAIPTSYNLNTTDSSDNIGSTDPNGYTKGCGWCHQVGGFATSIPMAGDGSISPHGNCQRCHSPSPHGTDVSSYEVLAERLINEDPDAAIAADIAAGNNGLATVDFTDAGSQTALTLGTGYLCNVCHNGGTAGTGSLAFAVNTPGAVPAQNREVGTSFVLGSATVTGHRVTALATTNWNRPDLGGQSFNAYYTGGGSGSTSQVAWAPSNTCQTCHDAKLANGNYSFPHGYTWGGSYAGKVDGASAYIWMNLASSATGTKTELARSSAMPGANMALSEDGLCLKCHVASDAVDAAGVGSTY